MEKLRNAALVLLLTLAALAEAETEPALVRSIDFSLNEQGYVEAIGGSISYLELNVSIPSNHTYQTASYYGRILADAHGNAFASIRETNPQNPYRYSVSSSGTARERVTSFLPMSYSVPNEYGIYASGSEKIQSTDSGISALAARVAANSTDDWEKVVKLASFVNSYVDYTPSMIGQEKDARWVFQNKRGVCVEFAYLYAAMARSQGIPTRVLSGYAYSAQGEWLGHAWAESYIGEWVPVDPTWLEAGHLDGTHLQVSRSSGNFFEVKVSTLMTPGARVELHSDDSLGGTARGVQVSNIQEGQPLPVAEFKAGASQMRIGGETVVYAKVVGTDYRLMDLTLTPCAGQGMNPARVLDGEDRVIATRPGVEEIVAWRVQSDPTLPTNYIWTCPLTLNSQYLDTEPIELVLSSESGGELPIGAWLSRSSVLLGEIQTVYYEVTGAQEGTVVGIITDSNATEMRAPIGRDSFAFTPKDLGLNRVLVYSSKGGVVELPFTVTREASVRVKSVGLPAAIMQSKPFEASIEIENSKSAPVAVSITASLDGDAKTARASVSGTHVVNFSFVPDAAGTIDLLVELKGDGFEENFTQPIEVKPQPMVEVENVGYAFVGSGTTVVLNLTGRGNPMLLNASIGSVKVPAQFGEVSIQAAPGERLLQLEWLDEAGNYYETGIALAVPASPTPTPTSAPTQTQGNGGKGCGVGLVLLVPAMAALYVAVKKKSQD